MSKTVYAQPTTVQLFAERRGDDLTIVGLLALAEHGHLSAVEGIAEKRRGEDDDELYNCYVGECVIRGEARWNCYRNDLCPVAADTVDAAIEQLKGRLLVIRSAVDLGKIIAREEILQQGTAPTKAVKEKAVSAEPTSANIPETFIGLLEAAEHGDILAKDVVLGTPWDSLVCAFQELGYNDEREDYYDRVEVLRKAA